MICKLVYNEKYSSFLKELEEVCSQKNIKLESYDEDYYKDRRKSIMLKAKCGTKMIPLVTFYEEKELIKAFYVDDNTCTIKHIKEWLN